MKKDYSMKQLSGNKGVFLISDAMYDEISLSNLNKIFDKVIVYRVERTIYNKMKRYFCVSPHFDKLKPGEMIPTYMPKTSVNSRRKITKVEFIRQPDK